MKPPALWSWLKAVAIASALHLFWVAHSAASQGIAPAARAGEEMITYRGHVAKIINRKCLACHRPGGAGPFSLMTYAEVRRRATLISAVTQSRYMPPWQPSQGSELFAGARNLTQEQINTLTNWVQQGALEGGHLPLPATPEHSSDWHLGPPDLVVELAEPFALRADGIDEFRNFVLPLPVSKPRFVKAMEFRPGNARAVHHAVMQVDRSRSSRKRDEADAGVGFGGMDLGEAENPGGQFIGWTPGKIPVANERLAWRLDPGTDMVMQLHMLPTGKPESVSPQIGLYFSDRPPTLHPVSLVLRNDDIDIPAGESDYVVEDDLTLPVAVQALGIYPHAHYLGKSVEVWAELPGGGRLALIDIPNWDFNWQDDYRYAMPVKLPAGAKLRMRYRYDNSSANVRNPNTPPARVQFGNRSSDEMATLTLQVLPPSAVDRWTLAEASARRRLRRRPQSWFLNNLLGAALNELGRHEEAKKHFALAAKGDPGNPGPVFNLGNAALAAGQLDQAVGRYQQVLQLEPEHPLVRNNLAIALQGSGQPDAAIEHLRRQLELSPQDVRVHYNLGVSLLGIGAPEQAIAPLERATQLDPGLVAALEDLGEALRLTARYAAARERLRAALSLDPDALAAQLSLGLIDVRTGSASKGFERIQRVVNEKPDYFSILNNEAWRNATAGTDASDAQYALALAKFTASHFPDGVPELLDTLAAALAASGQFAQAVNVIELAIASAKAGKGAQYLDEFVARRALYRDARPYRQRR